MTTLQNQALIEQAAHHLLAARKARKAGPRLPEAARPQDLETAFAIQQNVAELLGEPIGAWKCSLPSTGKLVAAPIYQSTIHRVSPAPVLVTGDTVKIEPEVAFVLKHDLAPRATPYSQEEILAAVGEVRLVLELMGTRYEEWDTSRFNENLADSLFNQGLFIGPEVAIGLDGKFAAFPIELSDANGVLNTYDGKHPDGGPVFPVHWLANYLSEHGITLKAGQTIITGSYAGMIEVPLNTPLTLRFGEFGSLAVELTAQP
jgi:2-keto-4-pentenoate hydratase